MLWFGPPQRFTVASTCPWLGHLVSGLSYATQYALFRLAFTARPPNGLRLLHTITRWIVLQKAPRHLDETNLRFFLIARRNEFDPKGRARCSFPFNTMKSRLALSRLRVLVRT